MRCFFNNVMSRRLLLNRVSLGFSAFKMKHILIISLFLNAIFFACAFASPAPIVSDFAKHETGWHWYEKRVSPREPPLEKNVFPPQSASEQLTFIKKHIENVRSEAILSPTKEHVKAYIALQNAITQNAELFSRVWQQVLNENPALRYGSPLNPTKIDYTALPIEKVQEETLKETMQNDMSSDTVLENAHHTWGLLYFFTSTCPYCQRFSPVVKAVSERYHLETLAVSVNGEGLPDFPHPIIDNGEAATLHVTHLPALFLVAPKARNIQHVTEGEVSETELIERLKVVFKKAQEKNNEKYKPIETGKRNEGHKTHPSNILDEMNKREEGLKMHERVKVNETNKIDKICNTNEIHETNKTCKADAMQETQEMNESHKRLNDGDLNDANE